MISKNKTAGFARISSIKKTFGMTLIELLIVIAIIAILGGIAYPLYTEQVTRARRADAQGALLALANAMEQHAARNPNTGYAGAATGGGNIGAPDNPVFPYQEAPLDGGDKYYDLLITVVPDGTGYGGDYTLQATAKGVMLGDDCGDFTLTSAGERDLLNNAKPVDECWK